MSELDKTLKAIADLCPENIPEIESLPIPELKIGDQCLLVWSDQMDFWRVKSFCANDGVDIVGDKFNAHMEVPRNELRLASDLLNARQSEIDQLKEMNNRYIGKMQEQQDMIAELKAENAGLEKKIKVALDEVFKCRVIGADRIHTCDVVEKALRGERE